MSHNNFPFVSSDYKLNLNLCSKKETQTDTKLLQRRKIALLASTRNLNRCSEGNSDGRAAPPEKENCIVGSNTTLLLEVCQHQYGWGHHTTPHHTWVRQRSSPNLPPRNTRRTVSPQGGNSGWNLGGTALRRWQVPGPVKVIKITYFILLETWVLWMSFHGISYIL